MKYRWLREGQYVRIRSATLEHHDKYNRTFGVKNYSNILSLPFPCQLAKSMNINQKEAMAELDKSLISSGDRIMHPIIASKFDAS